MPPIGMDSSGRAGIDWGLTGVPETFIVRGDGKIAYKYTGPITEDSAEPRPPAANRQSPALIPASLARIHIHVPFRRRQTPDRQSLRPAARPRPAAGRQEHFPSRLSARPACRVGETQVTGLLEGEDVLNTGRACAQLGATIERLGEGRWRIRGMGLGSILEPRETLDFGNAGTGSRLMMGVVGGHGITARFDGDASLRKRPMRRILDPLVADGRAGAGAGRGRALPDPAARERRSRRRSNIARRSPRRRSNRRSCSRASTRSAAPRSSRARRAATIPKRC